MVKPLSVGGSEAPLLLPVSRSRRGPDVASGGARARGTAAFDVGRRGGGRGDSQRCGGGLRQRGGPHEDDGLGRLRAATGISAGARGSPAALDGLDGGGWLLAAAMVHCSRGGVWTCKPKSRPIWVYSGVSGPGQNSRLSGSRWLAVCTLEVAGAAEVLTGISR
jgi:hypothetical protein